LALSSRRGTVYQATVRDLVEKTEAGYTKVQVDLTLMRHFISGTVEFELKRFDATIRLEVFERPADGRVETAYSSGAGRANFPRAA
jgi:hypothetical protein